jgi:hypothetical protein
MSLRESAELQSQMPAQLGAAVAVLAGLALLLAWPFVAPTLYRWTRLPVPVRRIRVSPMGAAS